jgi:sugar/nucleoside kinase (ribokinase family)
VPLGLFEGCRFILEAFPTSFREGNVLCFGFLTYCILIAVEKLPAWNGGSIIEGLTECVGEDAVIVATTLSQWQIPSRLESNSVAKDYYGEKVLQTLRKCGIESVSSDDMVYSTPVEISIVDHTGSRTYFQQRDSVTLAKLKVPSEQEYISAAMLYVDWYDGPSVLTAIKRARNFHIPIYSNIESMYHRASEIEDLLKLSDLCQVSLDEPDASGDPNEIAKNLLACGIGTVLITMGSHGCLIAQRNQAFKINSLVIDVVDGFGAGAAFSAGFIYGLRAGWPLAEIGKFATAHSGLQCAQVGRVNIPVDQVKSAGESLSIQQVIL